METALKYLILTSLCSLLVFTASVHYAQTADEGDVVSSYNYRIDVKSGEPIYDVTLYLPVPMSENGYVINVTDLSDIPSGWNCSIVNTSEGMMLMVMAPTINPNFHGSSIKMEEITDLGDFQEESALSNNSSFFYHQGVSINKIADHELDTVNPFEKEPLLFPRYNLRKMDTPFTDKTFSASDFSIHGYDSNVYTYYRTSSQNNVEILVEIAGYNQWWVSGWTGNKYADQITITSTGSQMGWQEAQGKTISGSGNYQ